MESHLEQSQHSGVACHLLSRNMAITGTKSRHNYPQRFLSISTWQYPCPITQGQVDVHQAEHEPNSYTHTRHNISGNVLMWYTISEYQITTNGSVQTSDHIIETVQTQTGYCSMQYWCWWMLASYIAMWLQYWYAQRQPSSFSNLYA